MIRHLILRSNAEADLTREYGKKYARWEGAPRNPWGLAFLLTGVRSTSGSGLRSICELRLQKEKVRGVQGGVRES
jgi:hypothetical protein